MFLLHKKNLCVFQGTEKIRYKIRIFFVCSLKNLKTVLTIASFFREMYLLYFFAEKIEIKKVEIPKIIYNQLKFTFYYFAFSGTIIIYMIHEFQRTSPFRLAVINFVCQ